MQPAKLGLNPQNKNDFSAFEYAWNWRSTLRSVFWTVLEGLNRSSRFEPAESVGYNDMICKNEAWQPVKKGATYLDMHPSE